MSKGENIVKWIKGQRISWLGQLERVGEDRVPKKIFTQELEGTRRRGRPRKGGKEEAERDLQVLGVRRWRELVIDRGKKMEGYCLTGQSPQWAVVPMEEEEEDIKEKIIHVTDLMHILISPYLQRNDVTDVLLGNSVTGLTYKVTPNFLHGYFEKKQGKQCT
jgi:hypothetical protein